PGLGRLRPDRPAVGRGLRQGGEAVPRPRGRRAGGRRGTRRHLVVSAYRTVLEDRTDIQSDAVAEAVSSSTLPREEKVELLRRAAPPATRGGGGIAGRPG